MGHECISEALFGLRAFKFPAHPACRLCRPDNNQASLLMHREASSGLRLPPRTEMHERDVNLNRKKNNWHFHPPDFSHDEQKISSGKQAVSILLS